MSEKPPEVAGTELARLVMDENNQFVWVLNLMEMQRLAQDQLAWGIAAGDMLNHVADAGSEQMGWNRRKFLKSLRRIVLRETEKPTAVLREGVPSYEN